MPIYEYACEKCGHEFERAQRITEDPVKTCPKCRAKKVRRLISRTAFVLKGSGWYSDLYTSPKPDKEVPGGKEAAASESDGAESKAEPKGDSKSDSKSDSKPESKGEGKSKSKSSGSKRSTKASRAA